MSEKKSYPFSKHSTSDDVLKEKDLSNQVFLITGATAGLGRETARALAAKNATLVLPCRDETKADDLKKYLEEKTQNRNIHLLSMDLASLESIRHFSAEFHKLNLPLNCLILNAGVFQLKERKETKDGFELSVGVNHLGHFLLTNLLLDKLKESQPSRVVVVSSESHRSMKEFNFDNFPMKASQFAGMKAYGQSKLCNILFANELNRRMNEQKIDIKAMSLHPGSMIATDIGRDHWLSRAALKISSMFFSKTIPQGAATTLWCATAADIEGGTYWDDCQPAKPTSLAQDQELGKKLWEISEKMVGLDE